ncbi:MAG: hypothetical protein JW798_02695 [Prolixibacteraceae bacterium]|nr:hypothetical protein [Prolixibacteraceae bacterium]
MKTLNCFKKNWKLAFFIMLLTGLPVFLMAQTPVKKESPSKSGVPNSSLLKDSTATVVNFNPAAPNAEAGTSKESEKNDTSVNAKNESFTQSQDEWLKNAGYFKTSKGSATKKSKRNPEPRQSADVAKERTH